MDEQHALVLHEWPILMTTQAIHQTHAMDATISWLSLARLDCYPHGQSFLILQRKTLALLAAQQIMGGQLQGRVGLLPRLQFGHARCRMTAELKIGSCRL